MMMIKKKSGKSIKKMVMKGKAPVDEDFPYASKCHVLEKNGVVWDAMLNQTNIDRNNNKYYRLQVLETDAGGQFYHWFKWGRIGYIAGKICQGPYNSPDGCISEFEKKFHDKSRNHWKNRSDFVAFAGQYTYLPMDYAGNDNGGGGGEGDDENDVWKDDDKKNVKSKLHDHVQELVSLIFDKNMMETQMREIGYDADKLPLGKVDKKNNNRSL